MAGIATGWGTTEFARESLAHFNPSRAEDRQVQRWWARFQRLAASPGSQLAMEEQILATDVRSLPPSISAPTLVLHRTNDAIEPVGQGRFIASQIPGASSSSCPTVTTSRGR